MEPRSGVGLIDLKGTSSILATRVALIGIGQDVASCTRVRKNSSLAKWRGWEQICGSSVCPIAFAIFMISGLDLDPSRITSIWTGSRRILVMIPHVIAPHSVTCSSRMV